MLTICLIAYLLGLVLLAVVLRRHIGQIEGFFLANRQLGVKWTAVATVSSWFGAGSTIATMNTAYQSGLSALWIIAIPTMLTVGFVSLFLAKPIRELPYLSQPEAIQARYGAAGRAILSLIILVSLTTFIASQLVAAIALLHTAAGISHALSACILLAAVTAYSCLGGFRMVVITDLFHFSLVSLALFILLGFTLLHPGIPTVLMHLPQATWSLGSNWQQNLLLTITFVLAWVIAPEMWQRMAATHSPSIAKRSALMGGGVLIILYLIVVSIGIAGHSVLPQQAVSSQSPLLFQLALQLPMVLQIIVLVGILSALTSTIDSSLNVVSLTLTHDIVHRFLLPSSPDTHRLWTARIATIAMTIPAGVIAVIKPDILDMLWLSATLYGCTMFVPILGIFYAPKAPPQAGVWAMILGAVPSFLALLTFLFGNKLAGFWAQSAPAFFWGIGLSLLGFIVASALYANNKTQLSGVSYTAETQKFIED